MPAAAAGGYADALAADGFDSLPAVLAGALGADELMATHKLSADHAALVVRAVAATGKLAASLRGWLEATAGLPAAAAAAATAALAADGFDSPKALSTGALTVSELKGTYGLAPGARGRRLQRGGVGRRRAAAGGGGRERRGERRSGRAGRRRSVGGASR